MIKKLSKKANYENLLQYYAMRGNAVDNVNNFFKIKWENSYNVLFGGLKW